jgi:hypothetical protein
LGAAGGFAPKSEHTPASGKFDRAAMSQYTVPVITGTGLLVLMMHADIVFVGASFYPESFSFLKVLAAGAPLQMDAFGLFHR